jgi:hypothetical protein
MGFKTEENCYLRNLLFAYDKDVITGGLEVADYIRRKLEEEYVKWELKIN